MGVKRLRVYVVCRQILHNDGISDKAKARFAATLQFVEHCSKDVPSSVFPDSAQSGHCHHLRFETAVGRLRVTKGFTRDSTT